MTRSSQPFRVVIFTGGPRIEDDVVDFALRLERDPDIGLSGIFCESPNSGITAVIADLWRRRGVLSVPLLVLILARPLFRAIRSPRAVLRRRRAFSNIRPRLNIVPNLHDPEVVERIRSLEPALGLVYGGPILKPAVFGLPRLGTLGIHHGKVPEYRGKKTTFWAMYNGEEQVGVIIQRIGSRLDAGDILRAGRVHVGKRLPATVKRQLHELGLDLYMDAVHAVRTGAAEFHAQPDQPTTLYRDPGPVDILRFWCRYLGRILRSRDEAAGRRG
jgi:hypothetical protein